MLRYTAQLQRFDDAHVEVAQGDDRGEIVAAATAVYTALIPTIIGNGHEALRASRNSELLDEKQDAIEYIRDGISGLLRAQEWGVGVYENANLIFWIGATREKSSIS